MRIAKIGAKSFKVGSNECVFNRTSGFCPLELFCSVVMGSKEEKKDTGSKYSLECAVSEFHIRNS